MMIDLKKLNRIHDDIRPMLRIDYILSKRRIFMLFEVFNESKKVNSTARLQGIRFITKINSKQ